MSKNTKNNTYADSLLRKARQSSLKVACLNTKSKNEILLNMSKALLRERDCILRENTKDILQARKNKLSKSFIDRLALSGKRIQSMATSLKEIAYLKDPVGKVISTWRRPNGLNICKVRVPIGVIFIIYEARPNVTSDCIGLSLKSSNVSLLRGGSASLHSNKAIVNILKKALNKTVKLDLFFYIDKPDYKIVDHILRKGEDFVDLVIPRGGEKLIKKVAKASSIPVIKHYKGVCHIYVDEYADMNKALPICVNAKVQRPSVCNAMETLLVHKQIAKKFLPLLSKELDKFSVELRGCKKTIKILPRIKKATQSDWQNEYLDLILNLKVVDSIDEAIQHINTYGSFHTDSIITKHQSNIKKFTDRIQSACVFVNISTRFSDGGEFGLGAEIGISTDKLHARGPMGLEELTTYKYVVYGNGQIRT